MTIWSTINDGGEEQRISEKLLDGLYEKGGKVPRMGDGGSERSGVFEVSIKGRRFLEAVQVFEGGWMSRDVFSIRRFQQRNLRSGMWPVGTRAYRHARDARTISRNSAPTQS